MQIEATKGFARARKMVGRRFRHRLYQWKGRLIRHTVLACSAFLWETLRSPEQFSPPKPVVCLVLCQYFWRTWSILDEDVNDVLYWAQAVSPLLQCLFSSFCRSAVPPHELVVAKCAISRTLRISPPESPRGVSSISSHILTGIQEDNSLCEDICLHWFTR